MKETRLVRKENDRMFLGVASGLAQYLNVDPTWVRLAIVMLFLSSVGWILPAYIIMALVMPVESDVSGSYQPFSDEEIIIKDAV